MEREGNQKKGGEEVKVCLATSQKFKRKEKKKGNRSACTEIILMSVLDCGISTVALYEMIPIESSGKISEQIV